MGGRWIPFVSFFLGLIIYSKGISRYFLLHVGKSVFFCGRVYSYIFVSILQVVLLGQI